MGWVSAHPFYRKEIIMALDAQSTPTIVPIPKGGVYFCVNGNEADASTAVEIKAAPGAGYNIYITKIILNSDDADAHPHLQDEDDTVLFGALNSAVESPTITRVAEGTAIKMTANKALELKAAAAGNVFVYVEGKVAETAAMGG
jgi:hypothetical protein